MDLDSEPGTSSKTTMLVNHALPVVLLGTILVPIRNSSGQPVIAKVLLDSGSCSSFITENFFYKLQLPRNHCNVVLHTVGSGTPQAVNGCTTLHVGLGLTVDAIILDRVVGDLPQVTVSKPAGLFTSGRSRCDFSDNNWNVKSPIDALFGADVYHSIVTGKNQSLGQLTLFGTTFGLSVSGPLLTEILPRL